MRIVLLTTIMAFAAINTAYGQGLLDQAIQARASAGEKETWPLTDKHGPVMIKVASFMGEGARGFALALTRELREKHSLDARSYCYQTAEVTDRPSQEIIDQWVAQYKVKPRIFVPNTKPPENWAVFVGDFESFENRDAKKMLEKIRRINAQSIPGDARMRTLPVGMRKALEINRNDGKLPGPLASSMLVRNPLLPHQKQGATIDGKTSAMLRELNDGEKYSVYQLQTPLTIQVANFQGVSVFGKKADGIFDGNGFKGNKKGALEGAAQNAIIVTETLRKMGYEAYVFHGQFASLVCVGGYGRPDDPRAAEDVKKLSTLSLGEFHLDPKLIRTPQRPTDN